MVGVGVVKFGVVLAGMHECRVIVIRPSLGVTSVVGLISWQVVVVVTALQ